MARAKKEETQEVVSEPQVNLNQTEEDIRLQQVARGEDVPQTEVDPNYVDAPEEEKVDVDESDNPQPEHGERSELQDAAYDLKDDAVGRSDKPHDSSKLFAARATFDTSGNAGVADQDMRRAYSAFDMDALVKEDEVIPDHLAKYVVSAEGAPAMYERAEDSRKDSNPKEGRNKKDEE